jgi:hypothetical protein
MRPAHRPRWRVYAAVETAEEKHVFDNPTPFTQRAIGKTTATKKTLRATVFIKDKTSEGGGQNAYLAPYVRGGNRSLGSKKGMLAPEKKNLRTNQYGNLPRGTLQRLKGKPNVFIGSITFKANGRTVSGVWQRDPTKRGTRRQGEFGTRGDSQGKVHGARTTWDCREFRVWAGIMDKKETLYVTTQGTLDSSSAAGPVAGRI